MTSATLYHHGLIERQRKPHRPRRPRKLSLNRKAERNPKIAAYATNNPCLTLETIGDYHGITRERVRQILLKQGVHKMNAASARKAPKALCDECGRESTGTSRRDPNSPYRCHPCARRLSMIGVSCCLCDKIFKCRRAYILRAAKGGRYAGSASVCPACEPKRRVANGRAMGRLPAGKGGHRERNPALFQRYYKEELQAIA